MKDKITDRFKRPLKVGDIVAFHSFCMIHACEIGTMAYDADRAKGDRWWFRCGNNDTYCGGDHWKYLQFVGEKGRHLLGQEIRLEEFTDQQKTLFEDMRQAAAAELWKTSPFGKAMFK